MSSLPGEPGEPPSLYLQYLPAIYQDDQPGADPGFLGRFLLSFQQIITGTGDATLPGIEEILDGIPKQMAGIERYFEPGPKPTDERRRAPPEFLAWLSGWVAMTLRADYSILQQRLFIAHAAQLYRWRGTKQGLKDYLSIFAGPDFEITIDDTPAVAAAAAEPREDGLKPYCFSVKLKELRQVTIDKARFEQVVKQIIDQQKPAHTYYELEIKWVVQPREGTLT